jgi:hypothetical protein
MKRVKANRFLRLETLEQREVPAATATLSGGSLFVRTDNVANNLVITQPGPLNQLKVENNGKTVGVFIVPGNLTITTGNGADNVVISMTQAQGFAGFVSVNTGNGNDTVDVGGLIKGNLLINTGLGNDLITSNGVDLTVRGSYTLSDGLGTNTLDMNERNYSIGGSMTIRGIANFKMGEGSTLDVRGSVVIAGSSTPSNQMNVFLDGANVQTTGSFQVFGEGPNDSFAVMSQLNIGGNLAAYLGAGDNNFVLTPLAGGNGVGGDLQYIGAGGADVVIFGEDSVVNGRTNITLGHGINTFVDAPTSVYAGDLNIVGGDGTNTVVVSGELNGNFINTLGNGDGNTTVFTGTLAGIVRYRLGNGSFGALTLAPTVNTFIYVDAIFGTGSSTFTLAPTVTLGGIVRGTGGNYTFNQGSATLGPTLQFINYP